MTNSRDLLKRPASKVSGWLPVIFIALAVVGFAIATYLTVLDLKDTLPLCLVGGDCGAVLTSKYARIGPVPTATFGMVYYLLIVLMGAWYLDSRKKWLIRSSLWLTGAGVLASAYLVYLQLFVIKAICPYCMASAGVCALLWLVEMGISGRFNVGKGTIESAVVAK